MTGIEQKLTRHTTSTGVCPSQSAPLTRQDIARIKRLTQHVINRPHRLRYHTSFLQQFLETAITSQRRNIIVAAATTITTTTVCMTLLRAVKQLNRIFLPTNCNLHKVHRNTRRIR